MLGKQFPISRRTVQYTLVGMKHRSFAGQPGCGFFEHFGKTGVVGDFNHGNARIGKMEEHGIGNIDLVCVNLYPFAATIAKPNCTLEDAIVF